MNLLKPLMFAALFIGCGTLCGCTHSRLVKNPPSRAGASLGWTTAAPDGVAVQLDELILRNTAGSWVRDADWDEYVLTLRNDSAVDWQLDRIALYSAKLAAPEECSVSRERLEARTRYQLQALQDIGVIAGTGIGIPVVLMTATIGVGAASGGGYAALYAAGAVGAVAIPVGLIGGTAYVIHRHHQRTEDRVRIDRQLAERGFTLPLVVPAGTTVRSSAFFPITPAPTRLVVTGTSAGVSADITLELPGLGGLHLKSM